MRQNLESQPLDSPNSEGSQPEKTVMTRDERIADGKEKVDALKNKAKVGLNKMTQGLKDRFYIGVSRSAELSSQIAEKGAETKEAIGNAWATAQARAAELFGKGKAFIMQEVKKANERKNERKMVRQQRRQEQRDLLDRRAIDREGRKNARRVAEYGFYV